ncbi:MAG: transposase [Patescibacteria group bacterium]
MPYRKVEFANNEIYHIILRGLDDNVIFKDKDDYYRGIFSIYEFDDDRAVSIKDRRERRKKEKIAQISRRRASGSFGGVIDKRDRLVDVLVFCFMPNHIHLLLKQVKENGIHKFMIKLGSGYGRYFNQKNQRKGYVFQNRFQSVHIKNNNQLRTAINYIHAKECRIRTIIN